MGRGVGRPWKAASRTLAATGHYPQAVHILVVEDDERIGSFLERGLKAQGHQVSLASDGADGLALALDPAVELVILDLSLPGMDGQDVLARLRVERRGVPVLVLTARDALDQKVRALDSGADDYLTKPFALDELLARIRALSRRSDQATSDVIELGGIGLDLHARRVSKGGSSVDLSTREFALLEYLMRHAGQVVSRTQILAAVWEYDFDPQSNVVDVYVRYLRRKIDEADGPSLIETVRGAGYRFRDPTAHR
jgi:DNA-binding response OmpR family regulator